MTTIFMLRPTNPKEGIVLCSESQATNAIKRPNKKIYNIHNSMAALTTGNSTDCDYLVKAIEKGTKNSYYNDKDFVDDVSKVINQIHKERNVDTTYVTAHVSGNKPFNGNLLMATRFGVQDYKMYSIESMSDSNPDYKRIHLNEIDEIASQVWGSGYQYAEIFHNYYMDVLKGMGYTELDMQDTIALSMAIMDRAKNIDKSSGMETQISQLTKDGYSEIDLGVQETCYNNFIKRLHESNELIPEPSILKEIFPVSIEKRI